ncbi:T9SS type A sorting domain-containing protein [Hymenobacter sp. 15J16-1T3B]|uniref:T9SS type A sorting domain-containing protein n=1 Tax=Hymenobacter sp. 15J16-1T3B TaxID=2886941 RepID=UPI001D0FDB0E|nr:T9SS type A sorting domain-containing protein [Hymenobacter sp. 15J16-1T3B]MCC3160500.1 T9SS type A sorting domain-containing protein [Hymenobacter sp. 15J16-1T3B]
MRTFSAVHRLLTFLMWLPIWLLAPPAHAQNWQWARGGSQMGGRASAVDVRNGSTVVAGYFEGSLTLPPFAPLTGPGLYVARFTSAGVCTQLVQAPGDAVFPSDLAIDAQGNITITGNFTLSVTFGAATLTRSLGSKDGFVARLSAAGAWTQAAQFGSGYNTEPTSLAVDAAGTATVVGHFDGPALALGAFTLPNADPTGTTTDLFVARLNPTGVWSQAQSIGGTQYERAFGVTLDAQGTATVVGSYESPRVNFGTKQVVNTSLAYRSEGFVASMLPTGRWTRALAIGSAGVDRADAVTLDRQGRLVVAGVYQYSINLSSLPTLYNSNAPYEEIFVAHLDTATNTWVQATRLSGDNEDKVVGLAVDNQNTVLVAGFTRSKWLYGGTALLTNFNQFNNNADVFVAGLSAAGTWQYILQAGGGGDDLPAGMAADAQGRCAVVGGFGSSTLAAGAQALANASADPVLHAAPFVLRTDATVTAAQAAAVESAFSLAPNPASQQVRLTFGRGPHAPGVQLLDGLGREVRRWDVGAAATQAVLPLVGLAPGVYLLRSGRATARLLVE